MALLRLFFSSASRATALLEHSLKADLQSYQHEEESPSQSIDTNRAARKRERRGVEIITWFVLVPNGESQGDNS